MLRQSLASLVVLAIVGCQASTEFRPFQAKSDDPGERTRLAAYAASTEFPSDAEATSDQPIGVIVNEEQGTIKILNFTRQPIRDAALWVNGSFVHRVDMIQGNGSTTISLADFYDATGRSLANQQTSVSRVQLRTEDSFYNLQGPIRE